MLVCVGATVSLIQKISNKAPVNDLLWNILGVIFFFLISSLSTTYLREKEIYTYAFWGLLRTKVKYEDIVLVEIIPTSFLWYGKFNIQLKSKKSRFEIIEVSTYQNWRELMNYLAERLMQENPNIKIDPKFFEKLSS